MLSGRAASFARSVGNAADLARIYAADLARIYLSIRSALTKRSLSRDAPTPYPFVFLLFLMDRNL
jgi:hypothetical protein